MGRFRPHVDVEYCHRYSTCRKWEEILSVGNNVCCLVVMLCGIEGTGSANVSEKHTATIFRVPLKCGICLQVRMISTQKTSTDIVGP
jgi:hypothetical protein